MLNLDSVHCAHQVHVNNSGNNVAGRASTQACIVYGAHARTVAIILWKLPFIALVVNFATYVRCKPSSRSISPWVYQSEKCRVEQHHSTFDLTFYQPLIQFMVVTLYTPQLGVLCIYIYHMYMYMCWQLPSNQKLDNCLLTGWVWVYDYQVGSLMKRRVFGKHNSCSTQFVFIID